MGRNRKTTDQLDRSGQLKARPGRFADRVTEPTSNEAVGPAPNGIARSPELFECWTELLEMLEPVKLTLMDRLLLEMTTRLVYHCRKPDAKSAMFGELMRHMTKFGLTPVDRSRVEGKDNKSAHEDYDEWAELAKGGAPGYRKN